MRILSNMWRRIAITIAIFLGATSVSSLAENKSVVEQFLELMGGEIPFPPEKIIDKLEAKGIFIEGAVFPHGRSLERRRTSYSQPRTLISFNLNSDAGKSFRDKNGIISQPPKTQIFIAYTPGNHELQIIGATKKPPFDFLLVENYKAGSHSRPEAPTSPGLCLSCHQNGGALFSSLPWSESNKDPAVTARMLHAPHLDAFAKRILTDKLIDHDPYDYNLTVVNTNLLVEGNINKVTQALCTSGCGSGVICRKDFIGLAVTQASNDPAIEQTEIFNEDVLQTFATDIQQNGHPEDFLVPGNFLNDRHSLGHEGDVASGAFNDPLVPRAKNNTIFGFSPIMQFDPITVRTPIAGLINQTHHSPSVAVMDELNTVASRCISFSSDERNALNNLTLAQKKAALASPAMDHLVQNWPVTPAQIVQTFLDTATSSAAEASSGQFCGFRQSEVVSNANLNTIDYGFKAATMVKSQVISVPYKKPSELFVVFCASCHYGKNSV